MIRASKDRILRPTDPGGEALLLRVLWVLGFSLACILSRAGEHDGWIRTAGELKDLSLEELLDHEVVSVSREGERLSAAPASITVITAEDIRRSGASRLPEALRLAPNLQVAQVDSRQWAISARGFNNTLANKMLVMIDGRTVYTPLFAGVFWDVQDVFLEDIDRIEVISGPGGTMWGANAVNGIINVISKSAAQTQGGLVTAGGGTELNGFGGVRYGGRLAEGLHYRVYGKYFDRDSAEFVNGHQGTNGWNMGQGGFRLDWEPNWFNQLTFQGDLYNGDLDQAYADDSSVHGGNLVGRWTRTFSEDSDLKVQFYYDRTYRRIPNTFRETLDTYDFDAQHRFRLLDRHQIVWGLGYRLMNDDIDNSEALAFLPPEVHRQLFSGFIQDRITLFDDRLHFTLGTKLEHNDYTGFELQPGFRLAGSPGPYQLAWAAISRAVRTPSRIDQEFYVPGVPPHEVLQGGEDFDAEELWAYEIGYRVHPNPSLALSVTGFYHDYDDLRSTERLDPTNRFPVVFSNGLWGQTYGAEFALDWKVVDWWRLRAGYTELQVRIRPEPWSTDTSKGSGESHDANHHFSLWMMFDLPWRLELDTGVRYVSEIANQNVPSYGELDVRLGWRPRRNLEFSIVGQNLLQPEHPEFGPLGNRFEIERSVYGKVTWQF